MSVHKPSFIMLSLLGKPGEKVFANREEYLGIYDAAALLLFK